MLTISTNKNYPLVYIYPLSETELISSDPLISALDPFFEISPYAVDPDRTFDVANFVASIRKRIGNIEYQSIVIVIHAFLLPIKEGVSNDNSWSPSSEEAVKLLSSNSSDTSLLSLQMLNLLRRGLSAPFDIMISTNNVRMSAWNLFGLSKSFRDRRLCTLYDWDDNTLVTNLASKLLSKTCFSDRVEL
jgi:hypothetical protein